MGKAMRQMGVGLAFLQETKVTDDIYPSVSHGLKVLASNAPSRHQGGIALMWDDAHEAFEVEAVRVRTPNVMTFQLVTGDDRYFVVGCYIPPGDLEGVHDVRATWEDIPNGCKPLPIGDLNTNL